MNNEVPQEVVAMHLRLFEKYVSVLIELLRVQSNIEFAKHLSDRIERVLAISEQYTRPEYAYLTTEDYDALDEFRALAREIIGKPTDLDEYMEGPPANERPEPESVLPEVQPDARHGDGGGEDVRLASDNELPVQDLPESDDLGPAANPASNGDPAASFTRSRRRGDFTESELDDYWTSRPDLTREQARRQLRIEVRAGLVLASHGAQL